MVGHGLGSLVLGTPLGDHPDLFDHVDALALVGSPGVPQISAFEFGTDVVLAVAPDDAITSQETHGVKDRACVPRLVTWPSTCLRAPQACESAPNRWDWELGADVYWAPDLDCGGWDGISAHGVYLDDPCIAQDLVHRGLTGEWDALRRGASLRYQRP